MITRTKVEKAIGKTYADSLDKTVFRVTLKWGYSKREMVDVVGCGNFIAAARLSKVLRHLNIDSVEKLYRIDPASLARTKGVGEACIFVAMCILESAKYDSIKWWNYKDNRVKFAAFKHRTLVKARKHKQAVA